MRQQYQRTGGSAGAGRTLMGLLMVAALVYVVSASAVGTWLAENLMAPAFEALAALENKPQAAPPAEDSSGEADVQQVSLSTDRSSVSVELSLPALDCYALQMGVFSTLENAQAQAEAIQSQGAGGYIHADGGRYRVLAAGYSQESQAKEVKDRLLEEGLDCTLYHITSPGATFRVSAQQSQIDQVGSGFSALYDAQASLTEAAIAFDRDAESVDAGKQAVQRIRQMLATEMAGLAAFAQDAPALKALADCQTRFDAALDDLIQNPAASHGAFSAQLKHTQLALSQAYADMVAGLSAP